MKLGIHSQAFISIYYIIIDQISFLWLTCSELFAKSRLNEYASEIISILIYICYMIIHQISFLLEFRKSCGYLAVLRSKTVPKADMAMN